MKAMSGRQYKYDLSDIVGILWDHEIAGHPISKDRIDKAIIKLYGKKPLPEISLNLLSDVYSHGNYEELYSEQREKEKEAKGFLLEFDKENPGELKGENINSIIEQMRRRKNQPNS